MSSIANQPGVLHRLHDLPGLCSQKLVQHYLIAAERLALFQVNRALTAIILQHAPSVQLTLAPYSNSSAREQAMEQILALAPEVLLKVHIKGCSANGDVCTLWSGRIKQHVNHLTLSNCVMTADMLQRQLQLQQCSHLQTLVLAHGCEAPHPLQQMKHLAQQRTNILPPTLTHLEVQFKSAEATADLIHLIGPQITHLTCIGVPDPCPSDKLSQLTHISLECLDDRAMTCLTSLPSLTHVTAKRTDLKQSHRSEQPGWEQLQFNGGIVILRQLQPLPLPNIKQLVIHDSLMCCDIHAQQSIAHLASCPSLQCVPRELDLLEFMVLGVPHSELISLYANSMECGGGLYLANVDFAIIPRLLPCIASLPSKVESLRLTFDCLLQLEQCRPEQRVQAVQQLVDALPQHIKQLITHFDESALSSAADMHVYVGAMLERLQSGQRPTKLVLAFPETEDIPAALQALAEAHSGHLQWLRTNHH